ncbi:MAG TPA: hypothetical protein VK308_08270, partial [Pyrinomonadaceae bacterium]|nr:hypothetical protein [Pyrinomonadaceae bacterium]
MRNSVYICLVICLLAVGATAQNQPFEIFSKAVAKQRAGFAGDKEKLSIVFNQERNRLGENFETELWKYLDNDVEKHYWVGLFLQSGT